VPGFNLERRADARPQPKTLGVHQQEDGGGVGRGHHRADQKCLGPADIERIFGDRRRNQRRHQHAEGGQNSGGRQHGADALETCFQSAIEQDQRQRHRADQIRCPHVVEAEAARPAFAGGHTDEQEDQQQGRTEAQREQAGENACHHENRTEQNGNADRVEGCHYLCVSP